ncbi:hypothetical protein BH11BAC3_BH11BAC3_35110 [soil metagenome]
MLTKIEIERYFNDEKSESMWFILLGITAIILALLFLFYFKTSLLKGLAIPFLLVGILQFSTGLVVYNRSDNDRKRNVYAFDMNPDQLQTKELPRMRIVSKNFIIYRYIEIALLIIGAGMLFYFKKNPENRLLVGIGLALVIEAAIALSADFLAEKRAGNYTRQLEEFIKK